MPGSGGSGIAAEPLTTACRPELAVDIVGASGVTWLSGDCPGKTALVGSPHFTRVAEPFRRGLASRLIWQRASGPLPTMEFAACCIVRSTKKAQAERIRVLSAGAPVDFPDTFGLSEGEVCYPACPEYSATRETVA